MKQLILIMSLALSINAYAQDDKTVTLVVSGQGKTQDEAKQNALRNAIEQTFGTFISSRTEILNDNLVKDEIVSIASGNIQKFEIISEVQIPNLGYATSLKATVSVTKLTSFFESKGAAIEFKGSLFAFNVNQQILNEKNEIKAIEDLCKVVSALSDASFEYSIKVSDPVAENASNHMWRIPMTISVSANNNLFSIATYINESLKGLSLSIDEAKDYIRLGKQVYPVSFAANKKEYSYNILRTESSVSKLIAQLYYFNHSIQNFYIENGIEKFNISEKRLNELNINDKNFRPFLIKVGDCMKTEMYTKGSVFFDAYGSNGYQKIQMSKNPILKWTEWANIRRRWRGCGFGWSEYYTGYDYRVYSTFFPYEDYFNENFIFLKNLRAKMLNGQSGVIIDFSDIQIHKQLVEITLYDLRSLSEINKITEYKVSPNII